MNPYMSRASHPAWQETKSTKVPFRSTCQQGLVKPHKLVNKSSESNKSRVESLSWEWLRPTHRVYESLDQDRRVQSLSLFKTRIDDVASGDLLLPGWSLDSSLPLSPNVEIGHAPRGDKPIKKILKCQLVKCKATLANMAGVSPLILLLFLSKSTYVSW